VVKLRILLPINAIDLKDNSVPLKKLMTKLVGRQLMSVIAGRRNVKKKLAQSIGDKISESPNDGVTTRRLPAGAFDS